MITQYTFDADTGEQVSRTHFPANGPITIHNRQLVPKTRECVAVTVKEGEDAAYEMALEGIIRPLRDVWLLPSGVTC